MEENLKKFIKNICCNPNKLTILDYEIMNNYFNEEEIFQIILLVAIFKKRTLLTFLSSCIYDTVKNIE